LHFADRVMRACRERNSRLVVGLDPHWGLIPERFKAKAKPGAEADVLREFLFQAIDAAAPHAAAFKPQVAFFERFGPAGMEALAAVLARLRELDAIAIVDGKRNDIGSTAAAYAGAYFGDEHGPPAFPCDALTINALLGGDGVAPFLANPDHGVFALVKTSNPSSGEFQDLALKDGGTLAHAVARAVDRWNAPTVGASGYGNAGAVIGATYPEHIRDLRGLMPRSLILVPGYGAQGGDGAAIRAAFNADGYGALINSARAILFPPDFARDGFAAVTRAAAAAQAHINRLI